MTYNLDGLNEVELEKRTLLVCDLLQKESVDIVHLNEVTPFSANIFKKKLDLIYDIWPQYLLNDLSPHLVSHYFCLTLSKKSAFPANRITSDIKGTDYSLYYTMFLCIT